MWDGRQGRAPQGLVTPEFAMIQRHFAHADTGVGVVLGVGDDGCLLRVTAGYELVVSVDTMVEATHFFPDHPPASLGHKALAAALSDLAAMGARPLGFLLALTLPKLDESWLAAFAEGLLSLAQRLGVPLVGGDSTRGPLAISVTVLGEVPAGSALRRSGARPGDRIVVSGALGGAAVGLHAERQRLAAGVGVAQASSAATVEAWTRQRLFWPEPRLALGQHLQGIAHAAIDLSDGLLADLGHVCTASGCGAVLQATAIPLDVRLQGTAGEGVDSALEWAVAGGEDYELLLAWPAEHESHVPVLAQALDVPLSVIGEFVAGEGVRLLDAQGQPVTLVHTGFDHFLSNCAERTPPNAPTPPGHSLPGT